MQAPENKTKILIQRIVLALVAIGLIAALGYGLSKLFSGKASTKKPVSTIKLIPDTPPPPPPPPPPPKEQPKDEVKQEKVEQPKPQEAPQPPSEALKMEGPAGDGPSPFTAGTVNNEYKGGNAETGKIGGTLNKSKLDWVGKNIFYRVKEALEKDRQLALVEKCKVKLSFWLGKDGSFKKFELISSSGDAETDKRILAALEKLEPLGDAPPDDLPQPAIIQYELGKK